MTHPAVYIVSIGLAVGVAVYSYIVSRQYQSQYSYNNAPKDSFNIGENNSCTICLTDTIREEEKTYLDCGHHFHTQCIQPWFRYADFCPNCRSKVSQR